MPARRKVSKLNHHQKSVLETSFFVNCYPNKTIVNELALQIGIHEGRVYNWFRHERERRKFREINGTSSICEYYLDNRKCNLTVTINN